MHPLVRDLFKRFLVVGRDYPLGLAHVRAKAKAAILANAGLASELEIKRAVGRGRWMVNELIGVIQLRKYRTLRKRYASDPNETADDALRRVEAAAAAATAAGDGASARPVGKRAR